MLVLFICVKYYICVTCAAHELLLLFIMVIVCSRGFSQTVFND